MKALQQLLIAATALVMMAAQYPGQAYGATMTMQAPTGLSILALKVTGSEFIVLQNNTASTMSLSNYWLSVFNNTDPLQVGVSNSTQQLPSVNLPPQGTLLLSDTPMPTCGASVAGKLSLSLTDGSGFLQIVRSSRTADGALMQAPVDFVSWSSGASGIIQNVPSASKSPRAVYYRYAQEVGHSWQQADLDSDTVCQLNIVVAGGLGSSSAVTPLNLAATSPPATIMGINSADTVAGGARLPAADVGLTAPQLSELLPNPMGSGNDSTDEFIELYNPNDKPFDLTGFALQAGLTTAKTFSFPEGTIIEPRAFRAFYATDTKLGLSNTSSQVVLLDPFGAVIAHSELYKNAKDGIAWAHAQGGWQWTTKATPGSANIINAPPTKKAKSAAKKKTTSIKKKLIGSTGKSSGAVASSNGMPSDNMIGGVIHTGVLALIGGLALLYGAYEYRRDLANRLFQLRAKLGSRRAARKAAEG